MGKDTVGVGKLLMMGHIMKDYGRMMLAVGKEFLCNLMVVDMKGSFEMIDQMERGSTSQEIKN